MDFRQPWQLRRHVPAGVDTVGGRSSDDDAGAGEADRRDSYFIATWMRKPDLPRPLNLFRHTLIQRYVSSRNHMGAAGCKYRPPRLHLAYDLQI